jgi:hypothetical protein
MLFEKEPYAPPVPGCHYSVRDKHKGERIVRVVDVSQDHTLVQVRVLKDGHAATGPIPVAIEALDRQAEKGWCNRLTPVEVLAKEPADQRAEEPVEAHQEEPVDFHEEAPNAESQPVASSPTSTAEMRLNSQHFHRCCGEIARAQIQFDAHVIREIGDGPFRAGDYEQAFQKFEQIAMLFTAAVANSRRAIGDARRELAASKLKLSGPEIQQRTAGFARSEQLINTAEREFNTIFEGLRLCAQAQRANANASPPADG